MKKCRLGEISNVEWGNTSLTKASFVDEGEFLAVSAAGADGRIGHAEHESHIPVISAIGANCGRMFLPTEPFTAIKNTMTVTPMDGNDSKFLYYFLSSIKMPKRGAAQPFLALKDIRNIQVPRYDIEKQFQIVSKLDKAFEAIDQAIANTEKNIENVEELFENTRHYILSGTKEDWKLLPLRDVCHVERGSSPRPIKKFLTEDKDGVNWVKIGDTKNVNKYIFHTNQKITKEGAEKSRRVESGDFILSNSMSYGKPYIMKTTGYIHDGWFKLKLLEFIDSEYLYHLLSSKNVEEQFHRLANGSVVKNISGDLVKKVLLPIPPKEEQLKIIVELDTLEKHINELKSKYSEKLSYLNNLKTSILERAFKGELT